LLNKQWKNCRCSQNSLSMPACRTRLYNMMDRANIHWRSIYYSPLKYMAGQQKMWVWFNVSLVLIIANLKLDLDWWFLTFPDSWTSTLSHTVHYKYKSTNLIITSTSKHVYSQHKN